MLHYVFAWQIAALLMGVALIPILVARMRGGSHAPAYEAAFPAAFLVSDLLMLARTLLFSTIHYDQSAGLGLFPAAFEDGLLSGLIYLTLVSTSVWAFLAGLFRTMGRRGLAFVAPLFWGYIGLILAIFALVIVGLDPPPLLRPLYSFENLAIRPFVAVKLCVIALCAWLALRGLLPERARGRPWHWTFTASLALIVASQAGDIAFRLDNALYAWAIPLIYMGYFGALFVLALTGRPKAETYHTAASTLAESWSREAGLEAEEARLLDLILSGVGNKEVAARLGLGLSAEKHRVQKLFRKLGVATRNELFAKASDRARRGA